MANRVAIVTPLLILLTLGVISSSCYGDLAVGYYTGKCGNKDVESLIKGIVRDRFKFDPDIAAFLLRLLFHDCMGNKRCDASLLLRGPRSEQTAVPNFTVKGYDLIEFIKGALEQACPGVVSCSDIIAAATRDAIVEAGGSYFPVPLGRLDGLVGLASDVDLPAPDISVLDCLKYYGNVGFSPLETVVLLGGHTVGVTHCNVIKDRLYNYKGTRKPDPSFNAFYVFFLSNHICQNNPSTDDNIVFLDSPTSVRTVDNSYYNMLLESKGILPIDNALAFNPLTSAYVKTLAASNDNFLRLFGPVIAKMSTVGVLTTGNPQGQIRKVCWKTN